MHLTGYRLDQIPRDAFEAQVAHIRAEHDKLPAHEKTFPAAMQRLLAEYLLSMHVRGDNNLESAKRLGKLDGRELYPDLKGTVFEEYATAFYKNPPPLPL